MKVLFLTNLPSPYRVVFFSKLGELCDLTVIYERKTANDRNKEWTAIANETYKSIFLNGTKIGNDNSLCLDIIKEIKREKYDRIVIGVYSTYTAMIAIMYLRMHKIPFIISADGGGISKESKLKYEIKKFFMGAATYWLSSGEKTTDYMVYYGAKRNKVFLYPFTSLTQDDLNNALLFSKQNKMLLREKLGMMEKKILLTVGRFSYEYGYGKGYDTLMKACEVFSHDIGIYIVGDEPTEEFVNWKKEKQLKRIHFIGFKNKQELAEYYTAADVFILLSKKDIWGLVINEAMAFSLPIITTRQCVAGVELVKENVNGYLVEAGDVKSVQNYVSRIFSSAKLIEQMGNESVKIIQRYTIEKMATEHERLFREEMNREKI